MTADALQHWLRLTLIPGIGGERQRRLLATFGLPGQVFDAGHGALARVVGDKLAHALRDHDAGAAIDAALAWAAEDDNHILTLADGTYPRALLDTADPPTLLYVKGDPAALNLPALAVVGSRNATPQGLDNAEAFARALAADGLCIVSGLALGIDGAAHRGAMAGGGRTVAVIGTGVDRVYPARHRDLARQIVAHGAIVSEFPLGTPAAAHNFPRRNRIIAGLARGVLVVEAAPGSGSLITARLAVEQGREVFAIPGSIHSPLSKGCHQLIREGAKLVETAQDILEEQAFASIKPGAGPAEAADSAPSAADGPLLDALGFDPVTLDTLAERTGLTADTLYAMLLDMELEGRVSRLPGGRFQRQA
ncbi:DNA-protecting protein DprA [Nitrogeniibacter mangrovi]|uniref:DNA-protecting protein DprA n=1 Tax=Nitrogeniibacter mangrovi TaxID=2016596 RepID=A0A6C1AZZ5_9RHOO|nr:DNA-processing protein DprA [Nitrogeniibacter mangrovi]QID16309.1 DNA-protecting protein DprA [Nitrogeniibacter mangrovi]